MTSNGLTSLGVILLTLNSYVKLLDIAVLKKNPYTISQSMINDNSFASQATKLCYFYEQNCWTLPFLPVTTSYPFLSNIMNFEKYKRQANQLAYNLDSLLNEREHIQPRAHRSWRQTKLYGTLNNNEIYQSKVHRKLTNPLHWSIPGSLGVQNVSYNIHNSHMFQTINNPTIYGIITKPVSNYIIPTERTIPTATARTRVSPVILSSPYYEIVVSKTTSQPSPFTLTTQNVQRNLDKNSSAIKMFEFWQALDRLERKFYKVTFNKLSAISPKERRENGISFAQSGLFLYLALMTISSEVDPVAKQEIEQCIELDVSDLEQEAHFIRDIMLSLPKSSDALKFRLSTRLVVHAKQTISTQFLQGIASDLQLHITIFNGTETPEVMTEILNQMVEKDSGGAMHDTFDEEELSEGVCAVLLTTMYLRARWRSPPTVLNGTHDFYDDGNASRRTSRMIRINDVMRYAELKEWDAQAVEISYATPGLSLLLLVPRGRSLRKLSTQLGETSIHRVVEQMFTQRVAVVLPLYTLRMTLLLPSKLHEMGISRLVDVNGTDCSGLKLSHAVQRVMFWSEAGRNAYKDDGIEWDEAPKREIKVNRPYIFFVRWHNKTLINGNFVL